MANKGKDSIGYVLIGIADDKDDATRFSVFYKKNPLKFKDFYICGVQEESKKYYKSSEAYRNFIENKIKNNKWIDDSYSKQILRNIDFVKYQDRTIIILKIENEGRAIKFDGKYYERLGTNTVEVKDEAQLWKRFFNI